MCLLFWASELFIGYAYVGYPLMLVTTTRDNERHLSILERFAREEGIAFVNTGTIDRSNQSLFLAVDEHLSGEGTKTIAGLVAEYLQNKRVVFTCVGEGTESCVY